MKANIRQFCLLQEHFQQIKHVSCRIQMCSQRRTEDIVMLLPVASSLLLFPLLTDTMLFERFERKGGNDNGTSALLRFRLCLLIAFTRHFAWNPRKHSTYLQLPPLKINILPFETQYFAAPHASGESKFKEGLQAMPFYS